MKKNINYLAISTTTLYLVLLISSSVLAQDKPMESLAIKENLQSKMQDVPSFFNLILPFLSGVVGLLPTLSNKINNSRSQLKSDIEIREKMIQTNSDDLVNIQKIEEKIKKSYDRLYTKSLLEVYLGAVTLIIVLGWILLLFFNPNLTFKWWFLIPMSIFTIIGISHIIDGWQGKD